MSYDLTDSIVDTYSVSKRLSFDFNTSSLQFGSNPATPPTLKRMRREEPNTTNDLTEDSFASSSNSTITNNNNNTVVGLSPWESRRLKVDLIEARGRIAHMKRELEQQHQIKATTEAMLQDKVDQLTKQVDYTTKKSGDLEKHVQVLRKRESTAKEDVLRAQATLKKARQQYDEQAAELRRTNQNLEETLQCMTNDLRNEISNLNRDLESALQNLSTTQDELKAVRTVNTSLQERLTRMSDVERELEEEKQSHQAAQLRVKDLQFQLDSYGEWQDVSKKTIGRLSGMGDLDKEVVRLRAELNRMRDVVGNKLLLEEQVSDLRTRLDRQEQQNVDTVQLQVQVEQLQRELTEWKSVAADHCPQGSTPNPISLRTRLEEVLKTNLVMSSEKQSDKSQRNSISGEAQELRSQCESYVRAINDMKNALKHNQTLLHRVQKKLMLVAKERDCYKQVIEHYEKEVTITGAGSFNPDNQGRLRLDMLEKSLAGYKDLCANLEKELSAAKGTTLNEATTPVTGMNTEQYERLRRDLDEARLENERLRRRKEELELKYEQLALKTSSLQEKRERLKVVHFQGNPADLAYEAHKQDVAKLQAEIERLRRTIRKMQNDQDELTSRFNETGGNMTCNIREATELQKQIQSLEARNQHMKEVFQKMNQEYREVVYMLFGYRVDRVSSSNYRLSSMYAADEEEYLNFRLNEAEGQLDLLESDYSAALGDLLKPLAQHHSLPVFLSSLTMELFNRSTVTIM